MSPAVFFRLYRLRSGAGQNQQIIAACTCVLSKRTDLNVVFTHVNNKTAGQVALGGNGYLGGAGTAGQGVNSLAYGTRHRF